MDPTGDDWGFSILSVIFFSFYDQAYFRYLTIDQRIIKKPGRF